MRVVLTHRRRLKISLLLVLFAATVVAGFAIAERTFYAKFRSRADEVKALAGRRAPGVDTSSDLAGLPEPLARYLTFSGVVGKRRVSSLRLWHSGRFKRDADAPWKPIVGEYLVATKRPSFSWYGKLEIAPLVHAAAFDSYFAGQGRMWVKAMSVFTIVDADSPEIDRSAFGRCVAEMTLAPSFFLDRARVSCDALGNDRATCKVEDSGFATDAELHVNPDGSLDRIVVLRYFDRPGGKATRERFTGKGSRPKTFGGLRLASRFDGYWNLAEGDLHYVGFDVDRVEYD